MSRPLRIVFALIICLMPAACATGPKFSASDEPKDGNSLIYVYRPASLIAATGSPTVRINDTHEVDLTNGGYAAIEVPAGRTRLWIEKPATFIEVDWSGEVLVDALSDGTYYVRWTPYVSDASIIPSVGVYYVRKDGDFREVDAGTGQPEITDTRRLDVKLRSGS